MHKDTPVTSVTSRVERTRFGPFTLQRMKIVKATATPATSIYGVLSNNDLAGVVEQLGSRRWRAAPITSLAANTEIICPSRKSAVEYIVRSTNAKPLAVARP